MKLIDVCSGCKLCGDSETVPSLMLKHESENKILLVASIQDFLEVKSGKLKLSEKVPKGVSVTFTIRCLPYNIDEAEDRIDVCSVYTRMLATSFELLLLTEQASIQLGVGGFSVGQTVHTKHGWVRFVDDLRFWVSEPNLEDSPMSVGKKAGRDLLC